MTKKRTVNFQPLKVLVACEFSGRVRDAFRARGHNAYSCDIIRADGSQKYHIQRDVMSVLDHGWDMMIAHPPCTYLAASGLHWNNKVEGRQEMSDAALYFVKDLMDAPIHRICIENPVGRIGSEIRPASQYIQPYNFGEDASKKTGLWLKNLPLLQSTEYVVPRIVDGRPRWGNQTDSGQNKLGPSKDRWKLRSETYQGIADAMAKQWG